MTRRTLAALTSTFLLSAAPAALHAQTNVSPDLSAGLGGFVTDRYEPPGFNLVNGIQGRNNVLQIDIDGTSDLANRPAGYQSTFYNTQGRKLSVNTSGSWLFESDLLVESGWATPRGYVRTDLWATATGNPAFTDITGYPIIGFTNYGGAARFRGYDVVTGAWIDFASTVNFGTWNSLAIGFDAGTNTFQYYVNGALAGSVVGSAITTGVSEIMYQAYNFNDPALGVSENPSYSAYWSNTASAVVPEPSTYALMAAGLAAMGVIVRRRRTSR